MKLFFKGNDFQYELHNVARLFEKDSVICPGRPSKQERGDDFAYFQRAKRQDEYELMLMVKYRCCTAGAKTAMSADAGDAECERWFAEKLYGLMHDVTGLRPPWGILTGVRPAKLARELLEGGCDESGVVKELREKRLVMSDKARLAVDTARYSLAAKRLNAPESYSLYVSVPFCPTRCRYCSFVSKTVGRDRALIDDYLSALEKELAFTGDIARSLGLRLETVYIGGGTPAVLSAPQIARMCAAIEKSFPIQDVREYSFEAGRPDVITAEKLLAVREAGITRLSINPQTANDEVLRLAGRTHTADDAKKSFELARSLGFDNINADLIAGLPGDSPESFRDTLAWTRALRPENVTVHALTLKRASTLTEEGGDYCPGAAGMVSEAYTGLVSDAYEPYYMYKQKGTVDNLENVGYCLPKTECLYNIFIMDELHTILACGAGAVSKLRSPTGNRIERIFNYKYPAEYTSGIDALLARKDKIGEFYDRELW